MVRALHASGPSRTARPWPPPHRARCSLSVSAFERDIGNAPPGASKGQAMKSALWQAVSMLQESNKQVGLGVAGAASAAWAGAASAIASPFGGDICQLVCKAVGRVYADKARQTGSLSRHQIAPT